MQVLYRLLANPEYIGPLREEVDAVITEEGWTKAGMDKMHKIDSFLRESQRIDGFTLGTLDSFAIGTSKLPDPDFPSDYSQSPWAVSCCVRSHFPTASLFPQAHLSLSLPVPFIQTKGFIQTPMNLMDFALRSFARMYGTQ